MKRIFYHWASRVLREQEQDLNYKNHIPYQFTVYDCINYILYIFPLALGWLQRRTWTCPSQWCGPSRRWLQSLDCFFLTSKSSRSSHLIQLFWVCFCRLQKSHGHKTNLFFFWENVTSVSFISCGDQCFIFIGVNSHCSFVHSEMLGMCWLQIGDAWLRCTYLQALLKQRDYHAILLSIASVFCSTCLYFYVNMIWQVQGDNSSFLVSFCSKSNNNTTIRFTVYLVLYNFRPFTPGDSSKVTGSNGLTVVAQALDFGTGSERGARSEDVTWQA